MGIAPCPIVVERAGEGKLGRAKGRGARGHRGVGASYIPSPRALFFFKRTVHASFIQGQPLPLEGHVLFSFGVMSPHLPRYWWARRAFPFRVRRRACAAMRRARVPLTGHQPDALPMAR